MENSLGVAHIKDANILTQNKIIYNTIIDILNTINIREINMKILQRGLKKEQIAQAKRYMRWYRVIDNEMRLFINLGFVTDKGEIANTIDYKNNKAYLCMADLEYSKKFYNKNKHYKVRLYAKNDAKSLYDEYEVKDWFLSEKGLELDLA